MFPMGISRREPPRPKRTLFLKEWMQAELAMPSEIAKVAGVTTSYISNITAGRRPVVGNDVLLPISEYWRRTVNDLYRPPLPHEYKTIPHVPPKPKQPRGRRK